MHGTNAKELQGKENNRFFATEYTEEHGQKIYSDFKIIFG